MYYSYPLAVTTPTGTSNFLPQVTTWPLTTGTLIQVELVVPSGHCGLTGIRLKQQFTEIIPWDTNNWVIANDDKITFPVDRPITQGDITVETYNSDVFSHTHYLRATILPLGVTNAGTTNLASAIPNDQLSGTIFG